LGKTPQPDAKAVEIARLKGLPRFEPGESSLFGLDIHFSDACTFLSGGRHILQQKGYEFESTTDRPRIIDCGANIGLSTLFFKRLYPNARITAFEADPEICALLKRNCAANGVNDVDIHAAAVWTEDGEIQFELEGGFSGKLAGADVSGGRIVTIPSVRLKPYLEERIDLLKVDIEGAEWAVLQDCQDLLGNVDKIFVEYHSSPDNPQRLGDLLTILQEHGFRYHLQGEFVRDRPFMETRLVAGFDNAVNVFGYRD
tara:strand:- start:12488 stop:13255 length:768 start_codon:yes stop_codon:yes gene_type:complete